MSSRPLYLSAAEELRPNEGQWAAYQSLGNCVVLAGPGSGKTKTLTTKLARMLSEDLEAPRGIGCITYNNECARELEVRLDKLGVLPGRRIFIGTVHSFSLTQILFPYAKTAQLGLPEDFKVATDRDQRLALERAFKRTIGGPENPQNRRFPMNAYRRSVLDRSQATWRRNAELAKLSEAYEEELRKLGVIDFEDMPLLALRALRENEWIRKAIFAKYPILAVDEYQDLGRALHEMVLGLCFGAGIRLFAVGDVDQSIYGFAGAYPELLQRLSERQDVETLSLRLNYRSGSDIVAASKYALGEDRGYSTPAGATQGVVYFHARTGTFAQQAQFLFSELLPPIRTRFPELPLGEIAILYPTAGVGDDVDRAAQAHGYQTIRTDTNALYPRGSRLLRWLEQCAAWCCRGWQTGQPRYSQLASEGNRLFAEAIQSDNDRLLFRQKLISFLWVRRDADINLNTWLCDARDNLLSQNVAQCRGITDEASLMDTLIARTEGTQAAGEMTLGEFCGHGAALDRLNLSTLHSAKGREFTVVILFGMDTGLIPRSNVSDQGMIEARRLFYVGFTRPKIELHIMYTSTRSSPFVDQVKARLHM